MDYCEKTLEKVFEYLEICNWQYMRRPLNVKDYLRTMFRFVEKSQQGFRRDKETGRVYEILKPADGCTLISHMPASLIQYSNGKKYYKYTGYDKRVKTWDRKTNRGDL
jgi:hypothetical protein